MKIGKKKYTGILTIGLAAVSLTGIGFSAWVINASTESVDNLNVSVSAGNLTDNRFDFKAEVDTNNASISFDSVAGNSSVISGEAKKEDLSFGIKTTIKSNSNLTTILDGIYVRFENDTTKQYLSTAISNEYVQSPIALSSSGNGDEVLNFENMEGNVTETSSETSGGKYTNPSNVDKWTYTITESSSHEGYVYGYDIDFTFNFTWGSLFEYVNPANAIQSLTDDKTMVTGLQNLSDNKNNIGLKVTVSAVVKDNA